MNDIESKLEVWALGELREIHPLQFPQMEQEAEHIIASLHRIAMTEFMSRTILSVWDWEVRTKHVFENNHIQYVKDVITLTIGQVNRLVGCGYKTRKEVYEIFTLFHIRLAHWSPEKHWNKNSYKFQE